MSKIIITETQLKSLLSHNINEQQSKMIPTGGTSEGQVKVLNGKYFVIAVSEDNRKEKLGPFNFKILPKNGEMVKIQNQNGVLSIFGSDPKNPKKLIKFN